MKIKEFTREKDTVIFNGNYMEVYIPKEFFDELEISQFSGHKIDTLGIFEFKIFSDSEGRKGVLHTLKCPTTITTIPSFVEDIGGGELDLQEEESSSYKVLKYYKGDIFIENLFVVKKTDNVNLFMNLLMSGKLPRLLPYDEILKIFLQCLTINSVNLKSSSTVYECIISEICRDDENIYQPFRFKAGKSDKVNMLNYKSINIKELPKYNSVFSAVTFENIDFSMISSINRGRQKKIDKESPVERTIKY